MTKDDTEKIVAWHSTVLKDDGGGIAGTLGSGLDITEQKKTQAALHRSEERFRRIIEQNADGMVLVNKQGIIRFANPAAQQLFGREESDLIGDTFGFPLVSGETTEIGIVRKGDGVVPTEMRVVEIEMREEPAYLAALRDITDRKRSEEVLRKSEERYRTIFEGSKDAIFISSQEEGRFIDYNQATLDLFGYAEEEIKLITAKDLYVDLSDRTRLEAAIRQRGFVRDYEVKYRKKNGQIIDSLITASGWEGSDGTRGFQGIVRDITEQKRVAEEKEKLEAQLRHAQKMEAIGTLAGGVAHDFNNLLTTILGNATLLLRDMNEGDPIYEEVEDIKKAAQRAASLTRQLLTFSRRQVSQPTVLNLNEVITEMKRMVVRMIGEDIVLQTTLEPTLWRVEADIGQMEQVIMNLVVNGRDAITNGGEITVKTANVELSAGFFHSQGVEPKPGSYVLMSVKDTGMGMDETTISKIFEPFYTTKARGKGTGLGLSTVYGIVTKGGGHIWVQSAPGKGSTFNIYLPKVSSRGKTEKDKRIAPGKLDGGETVLIVEDDDALRLLAQKAMEKYGYTVIQAKDGESAMEYLERPEKPIHLMVTDVIMPGMSGKELAEHAHSLQPEMKILYMSGYANSVIAHHGVLDPGIAFIEKPFTAEKLVSKVREVLDS